MNIREENTYLLDPEQMEEMNRLAQQGRLFNKAYGLLPPNITNLLKLPSVLSEGRLAVRVLDVGCATGEWGLALGSQYRQSQVEIVGIDISELMIAYARQQAVNQELPQVDFQVANALRVLPFDAASFDLIHLRIANAFIPRDAWDRVFREFWRILRPQGILISTEPETGTTTFQNPATAQIMRWFAQALFVSGLGFWDGVGSLIGIHAMQPKFFRDAGFEEIEVFPIFNFTSFGSPDHLQFMELGHTLIQSIESLVIYKLGVPKEEFHRVYELSRLEELQETFQDYHTVLSVTGMKRKAE
jgi:SAM-dependent methyltransferase